MGDALAIWAVVSLLGLAAHPIAAAALAPLPGAAAGLARPLGILLAAVPVWLAASVGLVPYGATAAWAAVALLVAAGATAVWRRGARPARRDVRILLAAELVFTAAFALGLLVAAHAPDVWGTEKPLDMALVNAVQVAEEFPPLDPWLSGHDLNYYYLGHYLMAFLARLAGTGPTEGYNVCVALVWALGAAAAFGVGAASVLRARALLGGGATATLAALGGNALGAWKVGVHDGPLAELDWFSASRAVPGTVNDFPAFEAVLGDLHAHVIAVPFTFLALAFGVHAAAAGPVLHPRVVLAALSLGALYPINAWSAPAAAGMLALAAVLGARELRRAAAWLAAVVLLAVALFLPFHLEFETSGTRGIGLVQERQALGPFVVDLVAVYGLALAPILAGLALRLTARARAVVLAAATVGALGLAPVDDLGGPALVAVLGAAALRLALARERPAGERVGFALAALGFACVLVPELVYVRDAFSGPLVRFNTAFKVGFEAWLLLGAAAGVLIGALASSLRAWWPWLTALAMLAAAFPLAAGWARTSGFDGPAHLDGLRWLRAIAPGDPAAIEWLRAHAPADAVVLEAHGPEYSPRGHARISVFTGRPTVIGWAEHELFYGPPERIGRRREDVAQLYGTQSPARARTLLDRYGVDYVVVGPLERETYPGGDFRKFARLGRPVFSRAGTRIYAVSAAAARSRRAGRGGRPGRGRARGRTSPAP